jgi:Flp pilus assembly protein TadD
MTDAEMQTYQQWMDSVAGDKDPYYMMAEALTRIGMDDEARDYLAAYEDSAQGTTGDYVRLSHLYRTMNAREDEGRVLSQWMETAPESTDARQAWADYQRRMGNYGEALAQYEGMAAATPDNPMPYRQMAEIYRRNGDYVMAEQQYETALAVRPGDISTMNRLADVRYAAGDLEGAMNVYSEIMAIEPGSRAAEQAERHVIQIQRQLQQ